MSRYNLRKATNQDNVAINQLYNRITGRERTLKEYTWEWLDNPAGESERWVICEESTGEIAGHHGLIPIRFNDRGTTLLAGKTENTMVAPEHRNKFVYLSFEKRMLEEAKQRFDLLFTYAGGEAPGMIRRRLGYESVGQWTMYLLHADRLYVRSLFADRPGSVKVPLFMRPLAHRMSLCVLPVMQWYRDFRIWGGQYLPGIRMEDGLVFDEHKEELEVFWQENKRHFGPTPERNGAYLEWRFQKNPHNKYRLFLFYEKSKLQGYAIIRSGEPKEGSTALSRMAIDDMVAAKNDQRLYASFLKDLLGKAKNYDSMVLKTVESDDALNRAVRRARLVPRRDQPKKDPFYAYAHKPGHSVKGWFITDALSEGL
jgi:hypothetical protein